MTAYAEGKIVWTSRIIYRNCENSN